MAEPARILLVEDDVLIGMMMTDMLDALGHGEPAQAATVEQALEILVNEPIAAALVDINMGDAKSWPVADALAARNIAFAFTTGGGDVIPSAHEGARIVTKPFRMDEIAAVLADLLARA